jgi:hypothetical protein
LLIDAVPVERYLPAFAWEHAKYPHRRPLPELVAGLQQGVGAIEDELKQLTATFADKTQKLVRPPPRPPRPSGAWELGVDGQGTWYRSLVWRGGSQRCRGVSLKKGPFFQRALKAGRSQDGY